jgi:hypothetical protein
MVLIKPAKPSKTVVLPSNRVKQMPCDTRFKRGQTFAKRKAEVEQVIKDVNSLISIGKVKPVVDKKTGSIAFAGIDDNIRDDVTDACIFRRIMVSGSSLAKAKIAQAEALAGRQVNKGAVAQGVHSHDGGQSWHNGH